MTVTKTTIVRWILISIICLVIGQAGQARIIYVDDDASGANNGTSWVDAYNYLQDALVSASSGDEIRVAQGTYTPDLGAGVSPEPLVLPARGPRAQAGDRFSPDLPCAL